ncbi:unnamed protein product [Umbelopsis ramanniana]
MGAPTASHCECGQPTYIFNFFAGHQPPVNVPPSHKHEHEHEHKHKHRHHKKGKKIVKEVSEELLIQGIPSWWSPRMLKKIGEKISE